MRKGVGIAVRVAIGLIIVLIIGELVARLHFGLGTPPLSIADPAIEYMFAPNQDVRRFGNRQLYNEQGMRSPPLNTVSQPRSVLVLGDSVLNGGNLTDQKDLATTIATDDKIFFGNASAGSWGPANMSAWLDKYGVGKADTIIVVLSSHDLYDVPTFAPLNPLTHPTRAPVSALLEGIERYLPRYLPSLGSREPSNELFPSHKSAEGPRQLEMLLDKAQKRGVKVCVILHQTRHEIAKGADPEHQDIIKLVSARHVPIVDFSRWTRPAQQSSAAPFRDDIHLNDQGQKLLVPALRECASIAKWPQDAKE